MNPELDRKRYKKVRWFFFRAFLHIFFWDVLLNRQGLRWLRSDPAKRWRKIAQRFSKLAVEMGGVLIKLGQFLSTRVDVLPEVITAELRSLRDRVPAESFEAIQGVLLEEFGDQLPVLFEAIDTEPLGAASLAQVHRARLQDGRGVVVKVQRPGIAKLVETDLAAIDLACRWLKWYKRLAQRVDLDRLSDEFSRVTRNELDFPLEAQNIERFGRFFADDPRLGLAEIYPDLVTSRVLTMENVAYLKIDDLEGLREAGIDLKAVAQDFFSLLLDQVFRQHFVHVDPHPGNVFIKPLPTKEERAAGRETFEPGETAPLVENRPFQIVLIDFGMASDIPERLQKALREYAIGVATRDSYKVVRSYVHAGALPSNADFQRIEEAHDVLFDHIWGVSMDKMQDAAANAMGTLMREYRDILFETPFQAQVDMMFVLRAAEIANGVAVQLDPTFNTWRALLPFAKDLAKRQVSVTVQEFPREAGEWLKMVGGLPGRLDRTLTQAERGSLRLKYGLTPDTRKLVVRIERNLRRLPNAVLVGACLIVGGYIHVNRPESSMDWAFWSVGGIALIWRRLKDRLN